MGRGTLEKLRVISKSVEEISDGIYLCQLVSMGYIVVDKNGNQLPNSGDTFKGADVLNDTHIMVLDKNNRHRLMTTQGKWVTTDKYKGYKRLSTNGYALTREDNKVIIVGDLRQFSNIIGPVDSIDILNSHITNRFNIETIMWGTNYLVKVNNYLGLLDYQMQWIMNISDKYEKFGTISNNIISFKQNDKWGVMDYKHKRIMLEPKYDKIEYIHTNGQTVVATIGDEVESYNERGKLIGCINNYQELRASDGLTIIMGKQDGNWYIINRYGIKMNKDVYSKNIANTLKKISAEQLR